MLLAVSVVASVAPESATWVFFFLRALKMNLTSLPRTVVRTVTSLGNALRSRARPVTLAASPVTSPLPAPALVLKPLLPKLVVVGL